MSILIDNIIMVRLDRKKIEKILLERGIGLTELAGQCGISRQTLYNMFNGRAIFTTPFLKLIEKLGVDFSDIVAAAARIDTIISSAPDRVRKAVLRLQKFVERNKADLFLFGSRAKGKEGIRPDWDLAIYFPKAVERRTFVRIKQEISDLSFPHRIDIVNLNEAPDWFLHSISGEAIRMTGKTEPQKIFKNMEAA